MKRTLVGLTLVLLLVSCGGKKDSAVSEEVYIPGVCPAARIEVEPQTWDDPSASIGSSAELTLAATAFDHSDNPVNVPLTWQFRFPDGDDETLTGSGHRLERLDNNHARFRADGIAPGTFTVLVQDETCNLGTEDQPQFVEGQAWITVQDRPGAAACGRMRVTYGDNHDRMGGTVIASSKVTLIAEVSAGDKLPRGVKVKFFINDRPYPRLRPLYQDPGTPPDPSQDTGYKALLPIYLVPGDYRVRYELWRQGQLECGSRTERFKAR